MAVKRRNEKKQHKEWLTKNAVKIKCCYCDLKDTCIRRVNKEKDEKMGIITRCVLTPNKKKKKKK